MRWRTIREEHQTFCTARTIIQYRVKVFEPRLISHICLPGDPLASIVRRYDYYNVWPTHEGVMPVAVACEAAVVAPVLADSGVVAAVAARLAARVDAGSVAAAAAAPGPVVGGPAASP